LSARQWRVDERAKQFYSGSSTTGKRFMTEIKSGFPPAITIGNKVLDFSKRSYLMGILNVTPDSFSDGADYFDPEAAVRHGMQMAECGADIIDVGGESTRPGADPVCLAEEIRRVVPVIKALAQKIDVPISIDTTKADVAVRAVDAGARMINDISALRFDPDMAAAVKSSGVPVVLMHMLGRPKNMQKHIRYESLMDDICLFLKDRVDFAVENDIEPGRIIVDPGIGFGKSVENDNFEILKKLNRVCLLGYPVLVGASRKAFIGQLLNADVSDRDIGTLAAVSISVHNGANIVRVHDVSRMKLALRVADRILRA